MHPCNHILFADDMTLVAQDGTGMQTLLNAIQEFEEWNGVPVNTMKTTQMTVDGAEANRTIVEALTYNNKPLPIALESESIRYVGFLATLMETCRRRRIWYTTVTTEHFGQKNLSRVTHWIRSKRWQCLQPGAPC
jgi:hypothetical protein